MNTRSDSPEPAQDAASVMTERHRLTNLAYRMLGSLAEAEDAVQETYTRWYALSPVQRQAVASPAAWLTTVASRVCLDVLGSARARRERYVGEWIPEPVPEPAEWRSLSAGSGVDPADRITLDESVSMAFLVVLESMTPAERVAFVLHDVFRFSFAEVAEILGRSPGACRQLASSARQRIDTSRSQAVATDRQSRVVSDLKRAWESGDLAALVGLLDPDATFTSDGGGLVAAALHPIEGAEKIAQFLVGVLNHAHGHFTLLERTVNGQPGLVGQQDGVTVAVFAFEISEERTTRIWAVRNPEKLRSWSPASAQ